MKPAAHFVGIGGIGMSALARFLAAEGWRVSGSDSTASGITRALEREGIRVRLGSSRAYVPRDAALVVKSQAIPPENPELRRAASLRIPVLSYPAAVGLLTEGRRTIAIAGAHGKSTTTALVALALIAGGFDPTVIVGTNLKEFRGRNFRRGKSNLFVLEADEYGRAFLHYTPAVAVVTNVDREHLDTYKTFAGVRRGFLDFLSRTAPHGALVLNRDDRPLAAMHGAVEKIAHMRRLHVLWYSKRSPRARRVSRHLRIPGTHNVSNALAALTVAVDVMGMKEARVLKALGAYRGAWRRMEYRGTWHMKKSKTRTEDTRGRNRPAPPAIRALRVYDDYAHHPTEIRATLAAFREQFPEHPIICVFQPHQMERLRLLFTGFRGAFGAADALITIPPYIVPGRDKISPKYTSKALAEAIRRDHPRKPAYYLPRPAALKKFLSRILPAALAQGHHRQSKAILVMMGAGNIVDYTKTLL